MRKRPSISRKPRQANSNKRRILLKKLHKKVLIRRQQYLQFDMQETCVQPY